MIRRERTTKSKQDGVKNYFNISNEEYNYYNSIVSELELVIDVGAADSFFNRLECEVHFFEPDTDEFNYLLSTANKSDKYTFNKKGLGSVKENKTLYNALGSTEWYENTVTTNKKNEVVEIITLNDYIKYNNIEKISLLKIDVEGMEYDVLLGCDEYINICEKIVYECSSTFPHQNLKIKDILKNFTLYYINNDGTLTELNDTHIGGNEYLLNILAINNDTHY